MTDTVATLPTSNIALTPPHKDIKTLLWCPAHPVQHVRPALHGYTLEHRQHGKGKVVKVGDAIVRALPSHFAQRSVMHTVSAIRSISCTRFRLVLRNGGCDKRDITKRGIFTLYLLDPHTADPWWQQLLVPAEFSC